LVTLSLNEKAYPARLNGTNLKIPSTAERTRRDQPSVKKVEKTHSTGVEPVTLGSEVTQK
jgi:hypothetical protein